MQEFDPVVLLAIAKEMLSAPLLWGLIVISILGTVAFLLLLVRERGFVANRMLTCQMLGLLGGVVALAIMAKASSSGYTDAAGPIDWIFIAAVFLLGTIGTTIIAYSVFGWIFRTR